MPAGLLDAARARVADALLRWAVTIDQREVEVMAALAVALVVRREDESLADRLEAIAVDRDGREAERLARLGRHIRAREEWDSVRRSPGAAV